MGSLQKVQFCQDSKAGSNVNHRDVFGGLKFEPAAETTDKRNRYATISVLL